MSRNRRKQTTKREQRRQEEARSQFIDIGPQKRVIPPNPNPLKPWTAAQADYLATIAANQLTFSIGPAGTGKSYIAAAHAAELKKESLIEKIILTRPAVESGESLGFLPGELDEKFNPFIRPLLDALTDRLGSGMVEYMLAVGDLELVPLAYMRGLTFSKAMVIMTEAQNTTPKQMQLFLTRIGDARVVVDGDTTQKDIRGLSGLEDAVRRLRGIKGVGFATFTADDCVRSGLVREVLRRYERNDNDNDESDDEEESGPRPWEKWTNERRFAA